MSMTPRTDTESRMAELRIDGVACDRLDAAIDRERQ